MLRHPGRVGSMLRAGTPELWRDHDIPSKGLGARGFGFEHGGSWGLGSWALRFIRPWGGGVLAWIVLGFRAWSFSWTSSVRNWRMIFLANITFMWELLLSSPLLISRWDPQNPREAPIRDFPKLRVPFCEPQYNKDAYISGSTYWGPWSCDTTNKPRESP